MLMLQLQQIAYSNEQIEMKPKWPEDFTNVLLATTRNHFSSIAAFFRQEI